MLKVKMLKLNVDKCENMKGGSTKKYSIIESQNGGSIKKYSLNNDNNQTGGLIELNKESKTKKITQDLLEKLKLLSDTSYKVRQLVSGLISIISDQSNENSFYNIRLKFEWLVSNFRELVDENDDVKNLFFFEDIGKGLTTNIDIVGGLENQLRTIYKDTGTR